MVVTSSIVSEVLHIPRVAHPDYPSYEHLQIVSKDKLPSLFFETPYSWGNRQNTSCLAFAKGLRILIMLMTVVLHPLSHYNTHKTSCSLFVIPHWGSFYWLHFLLHILPYRCLWPVISSFFLRLWRSSFAIFPSSILSLPTSRICVS